MRIGGFYVIQTKGVKTCSNPLLVSEGKCKAAGGVWDYHSPHGESTFKVMPNIPDEKGEDFYWTGVLRQSFTEGVPGDFNYKKTCTDASYHNQKDCEDNGSEWSHRGWESGEQYEKNDLVSYYGVDDGVAFGDQKLWYYCITENNSIYRPHDGDGNWQRLDLKSYLYEGDSQQVWEPDAYHAYDRQQQKRTHRYNEGGNAVADEAEMGPNEDYSVHNEEDKDNQFYLAAIGHFNIYETCHGTRPLEYQGISGNFNFYNATYPAGSYSPPYGETPTLTLIGGQATEGESSAGFDIDDSEMLNFMAGDCCPDLDSEGELGMWGMKTTFPIKTPMVTWDQKRGDEHAIHAPAEECPPENPPNYFFEEQVFSFHPGSIMAPGAGTFYNDNPFPNSCDIDGWFASHVYKTQRCSFPGGEIYNGYKLYSGFPKLTYPTAGSNESKLDAGVCKARMCETTQEQEYGFDGVQLGMGDPADPGTAINDQASFASYDASNYWHFIFQYNHKSLWNESENTVTNQVVAFAGDEGPREDHLWEYRQCPNTPDFLPWSSDCPIHSCPSHYFDIPYYAAIGKFGFYGTRFFNICSTPRAVTDNERGEEENEFNYYTARKISSDGVAFENKVYDLKGLANNTAAANSECLRINDGCYEVTYVETTTDDRAVDIVIGSTSPTWESKTISVDLQYDVYEKATSGGLIAFDLGHLNLTNTIIWDTVSFDVSACQDCLDGGQAAIDKARLEVTKKIEAKLGVSQSEIADMRNGVGQNYCEAHIPACAPYIHHGSVAFNPSTTLDAPFEYLDGLAATNAFRQGADNIHGTDGQYSTKDSKVDIVIDYPAGVQNCTPYEEPSVRAGVCGETHFKTLLEIAKNEQRVGEFFAGNIGFFLWANYEHVVDSYEYRHLLTGSTRGDDAELRFKSSLHKLKSDFDQILTSLPNFLNGLDDPVVYYKATEKGLFGNEKLDYSRQGLFNDMLFSNRRYRQFLQETEWESSQNLFALSASPTDNPNHVNQMDAWNKLLDLYGSHIAVAGGQVDQHWYKTAIEGKEKRVLTRYVENKLRGRSIDLFPTNQITFSTDSASNYISGKHWGNSEWGDSVAGNHMGTNFDPLPGGAHWTPSPTEDSDMANPGVSRRYFWGVYSHVSTVTGWHDRIENAKNMGGAYYYGGLYQDFACGGDRPLATYTAGGIAVGADDRALPKSPWQSKGYNDVGRVSHGFSCFSPIFVQQPLNVTCKIGQRPTFRSEAVDYHTIPEDKINKGYPEIDFWTNSLKLTNSRGEFKYPVRYKWYRIQKSTLSPNKPEEDFDKLFHANDQTIFQEASITGEWACMEGLSGIGTEDCTLFHPQATYTHEMVEGDEPYRIQSDWNGRKYGADHWTKLVDYKGEVHKINSAKKQGPHRLWKTFNYIQGAITAGGRTEIDEGLPSIPTFSKNHMYADMMVNKYGLDYSTEYGDDEYLYFCVASGRFGFRRTEAVNLDIEDWIKQDYSIRNGAPVSIPMESVGFDYTRVDQEAEPLPPEAQNDAHDEVSAHSSVVLKKGWGAEATTYQKYNSKEASIPAFAGLQRDANQVWENHVSEKINLNNNCRSYAFVGKEGYRGTTRSLKPPVAGTINGETAERSSWFEYGLLYSFGTKLSQAWGNALYSQSQMPICRNYEMPRGCTAQGFQVNMTFPKDKLDEQRVTTKPDACGNPTIQTENVSLTSILSQNNEASAVAAPAESDPRMYHWSVLQSALIVDNLRAGIPNWQHQHHGEHYNFYDDYGFEWQHGSESGTAIAYHARGVSWQFHNNLGTIKRFGHWVKLPGTAFTHPGSWYGTGTYQNTDDVYFWCWRGLREIKRNFDAAQRLVTSSSLAGVNCGWRMKSCGRYMLYWVETYQRYYNACPESGDKITNLSYISPGLRAGSAACQYFLGGFPSDTYVKRTGLLGPYAYEWKVSPHNRDRNGNGVSESFYSMKFERPMRLYDPPAIYGLWARQTPSSKVEPQVEAVRKLRNRAASANGHIGNGTKGYRNPSFTYIGPPGTAGNGGCGAQRIRCVDAPHKRWYRPYRYGSGNVICDWYTYAIKLGADQGWNYGCSEQQLIKGLCFDPCLSMKYNYGFFPGGKLLSLNRYVKYKDSRHNKLDKGDGAGGVLPGASSQRDESQGQSAVKVDESTGDPQGQPPPNPETTPTTTPTTTTADPIAVHAQGTRFITQLTGDVADEENAITKNRGSKSVRMLRGPWATPYRRIKKTLIKQPMATLGDNVSNSDVVNASQTLGIDEVPEGVEKYEDPLNHKPYKKRVASVYTDTTVSPCNSGGADHCNYVTPTMHLGIDVVIEGYEAVFNNAAANIMGQNTGSRSSAGGSGGSGSGGVLEGGVADGGLAEFLRQIGLFTRFMVNSWGESAEDNPFIDENGQPLSPEQTIIVLGEMNPETTIQTLGQYLEDNCSGKAGTFYSNLLQNMREQLDEATTTYVEGEIAARAERVDGSLLLNATLIQLDALHQNGQLVVI